MTPPQIGQILPPDSFSPSEWQRGDGPLAVTAYYPESQSLTVAGTKAYVYTRAAIGADWVLRSIE